MKLLPKRFARFTGIDRRRRTRFESFEVQIEPGIGRQRIELRPVGELDERLPAAERADQILLVPAREDDQLAGEVVHTGLHDRGVPLPTVLPHDGRIGLHRIFVKVVENEAVHTVARERPLAADREQAAPVTDDLHLIGRTQVLRRPGSPLDGRFREKGCIFGRIDDTLHAPVELRSQRSRIGGDGDPQIGIAPQQVGGQQGRSPDALAMLGRHGDDKPADAPGGECLQYAVVGLVKPPELQKGIDSGGKQAERRQIPRRSRFCGGQVLQYIYIHRSVVFKLRPVARRCRREAEGFDTQGSAGFQNRRIRQSQNSVQLFERQRKNGTARCSGYRKPRTMCSEKDRRRRRSG